MHSSRSVFASQRFVTILSTALALPILVSFATRTATAQDDLAYEPYVVFVAHDEVHARCGPSGEYYRTDPLRHGQELEVYVETEDGWLGVRPPENSFCWLPASAVELSGQDDIATVTEDRSVAWIGTHLGRARQYRWQVQLAEGEEVTVIGRSERDGPDGPQLWYRIVPPSGEFRWVHRDQTVNSTEALVALVREQTKNESDEAIAFPSVERRAVKPVQHMAESLANDERLAEEQYAEHEYAEEDQDSWQHDPLSRSGSSRRTIRAPGESSASVAPFKAQLPSNRRRTPQPVVTNDTPTFREAPRAKNREAASLDQNGANIAATDNEQPIGSGLQQNWRSNAVRGSVENRPATQVDSSTQAKSIPQSSATFSNASFIGKPRLIEIGSNLDQSVPSASETAGDGNWVSGVMRQSDVAQVAGISPMPAQTLVPAASNEGRQSRTRVVPMERITRVANEVRGADIEKIQLVLSRLMAESASSEEMEPLVNEAYDVARTAVDDVTAGRARLVAERAEQYQRVAERREGTSASIRSSSLVIPTSGTFSTGDSRFNQSGVMDSSRKANTDPAIAETGFLVQVYSARTNSPPFALTDHSGNTIAYVTPSPGINLRTHLNSRISVTGNVGYLQGLNTPHILVTKAIRTRE